MITARVQLPDSLEEARAVIEAQATTILRLLCDVDHLKKILFANLGKDARQRGEDPDQTHLFGAPPAPAHESEDEPESSNSDGKGSDGEGGNGKSSGGKGSTGRQPLPSGLPRIETIQPVDDDERMCQCCDPAQERAVIGYETTETLEYVPAKFVVNVTKREKCACPSGNDQVVTTPLPPRIIEKGRPGTSLLTFVMVAKFVDHLPLYRIAKILRRDGVRIPETTLCDWVGAVADALTPIVLLMKRALLAEPYLQADETPAKARAPDRKGKKLKQIYFFVYGAPGSDVIFDYRTSRAGSHAVEFLDGFEEGVLQVDEYSGYTQLFRKHQRLVRAGCWAHTFRKFEAALKAADRPTESKRICTILSRLSNLENLMREKGRSHGQRLAVRARIHRGQLGKIEAQVDEALANPKVELQSQYGKAVRYVHNHWESLTTFLRHGHVEMDNNAIERAIRPLAIGRKNWLHIGHIEAGDRAAIFYSIFSSCIRRGIDPSAYLSDVLDRLPTQPLDELAALTPAKWAPRPRRELSVHLLSSASPPDPAEAAPAPANSEATPEALAVR